MQQIPNFIFDNFSRIDIPRYWFLETTFLYEPFIIRRLYLVPFSLQMSRLLSSIRLRTSRFVQASEQMEHMPVAICVDLSSLLCGPGIGEDGRLFLLKSDQNQDITRGCFFLILKSTIFWTRSGSINISVE